MSRAFGPLDTPPPLLAVIGNTRAAALPQLSRENNRDEPPSSAPSSIKMVIIIISSAIIFFASLHLLLRYLSRRCHRSENGGSVSSSSRINGDTLHRNSSFQQQILADDPIKSLPFFCFSSVRGDNFTGGDCAVCLSKFESNDQLRLLPLCCHAFHVECIDTWLSSRETCPLCRSTVYPTEAEVRTKTLSSQDRGNSFRIEIGSLSRRQRSSSESDLNEGMRSYPIGSYDYIVEDSYEVSVGRPSVPGCDKDVVGGVPTSLTSSERVPELPGEGGLVSERSWLMDYVDRLSSFSSSRMFSLRRSGRFFNGSLRRSEGVTSGGDLEANRVGEEISEIFGWLSRV